MRCSNKTESISTMLEGGGVFRHEMAAAPLALVRPSASFGPLVPVMAEYGFKRTTSFAMARSKVVDTFLVGRRRYVTRESIEALCRALGVEAGGNNEH